MDNIFHYKWGKQRLQEASPSAQTHTVNPFPLTSEPVCWTPTQSYFGLTTRKARKYTCPLPGSLPAVTLIQPILWSPCEDSCPSPNSQVQWQVHRCPLTHAYFKAVINPLESELPPPTWAIFQPFSGTIIRDKDVNISSPQLGKTARGLNLGEFPVGSCSLGNCRIGLIRWQIWRGWNDFLPPGRLPCFINRTYI